MGIFSKLFTPSEPTAEEIAAKNMDLLKQKLNALTLKLAHKRIAMHEGENAVSLDELQKLSDYEISSLPENSIVTMAGIYKRCIDQGANNEVALKIVNSTRVAPIQWNDTSKFQTIEEYIVERLKVELAAMDAKNPILKYLTKDNVSAGIQQTNLIFKEVFG